MAGPLALTSIGARLVPGFLGSLRADERALVGTSATVFALASAGAAMSAAAADAMFLSDLGADHFGEAVAISSALLAVVLAVVGGLADRLERRRILSTLAIVSAVFIAGLAALSLVAPGVAAAGTFIGGKQLAAATDLAFWVVIAERLDARRSRRMLPVLAATGGIGAAAGSVLVFPIVSAVGTAGVLVCAAVLLAIAGIAAARLPATRRVRAPVVPVGALIVRSWRDGARAVRRNLLARHLAMLVAAAGVFASLAYFALGISLISEGGSKTDLAALIGGVRGAGQVVTLVVQLAIAPRLLSRLGTGHALLLAPLVALAAGLGLVIAPILAVAIATQISARALDSGIETPAEKLAQTLLPSSIRGRVAGFLDGTAKRAGMVVGGLAGAALVGSPLAFYLVIAVAAALWLLAATRIAKELPALAIEHVAQGRTELDQIVDARGIELLVRELSGAQPARAAEVLARLHATGRVDAVPHLVRAVTAHGELEPLWRALVGVLDSPIESHGQAILTAAKSPGVPVELAVRAVGLCGGVPADELAAWRVAEDAAVALTAEVAVLRLARDGDAALAMLADAVRASGPVGRAATDELCVEITRGLAARAEDRMLEAARHLTRALRRGRGDIAGRAQAFTVLARVVDWASERRSAELSLFRADLLELARERVEAGATPVAPDHMLTSLVRMPDARAHGDDALEVAAAIRLYGTVLEGVLVAGAIESDDLRRLSRALGEPDDDVRAAAEDALTALGPAAAGELVTTAAWGRRRARDRAAALLAELPVTPAALDRLIDAELDALESTHAAIAVLVEPGDELLARRLDERLREIAHTVLLLVAARRRSPAIASAAAAWGHARGGQERARTLAVIEAALPRALVNRLADAVDDLTPTDRAAALARAGITPPVRDSVVRAELAGRDRLARALALHVLGAAGRSAHRATISQAAHTEALASTPTELLRRLTKAVIPTAATAETHAGEPDMPTRVETLIALGRVPLLATLTTRQLADVAERARWSQPGQGSVIVTAGDLVEALIVVEDGELELGDRRIVKGETVDELACVAPISTMHDLRAVRPSRLIRLERVDFEELVDDVPGLAAAVCRALGERARRAEDAAYRSPLSSRA